MNELLRKYLNHQWYFGTSSWKYEGWKGLIYKEPYSSDKSFQENCLKEYGTQYTCVGVDHTYYNWPSTKGFAKYIEQTPEHFRFVLKATDKITVLKYPRLSRYGKEAGRINTSFLDPVLFREKFLEPLFPYKKKIGPIMFEFSQFHKDSFNRGSDFVERLDRFLEAISKYKEFRFAVEIRNSNWLHPTYFDCLVRHNIGHVFNSWSRMPQLKEQFEKARSYRLPFIVSRLLLNPGTIYQDAVDQFLPYDKLHLELSEIRAALIELIFHAKVQGIPAYTLVNNRFEGCAPKTLEGIFSTIESKDR